MSGDGFGALAGLGDARAFVGDEQRLAVGDVAGFRQERGRGGHLRDQAAGEGLDLDHRQQRVGAHVLGHHFGDARRGFLLGGGDERRHQVVERADQAVGGLLEALDQADGAALAQLDQHGLVDGVGGHVTGGQLAAQRVVALGAEVVLLGAGLFLVVLAQLGELGAGVGNLVTRALQAEVDAVDIQGLALARGDGEHLVLGGRDSRQRGHATRQHGDRDGGQVQLGLHGKSPGNVECPRATCTWMRQPHTLARNGNQCATGCEY